MKVDSVSFLWPILVGSIALSLLDGTRSADASVSSCTPVSHSSRLLASVSPPRLFSSPQGLARSRFAAAEPSSRPHSPRQAWSDARGGIANLFSDFGHIYSSPFRIDRRSALWLGGLVSVGAAVYAFDQELYDSLKRNEHVKPYEYVRDTGEFLEPLGFQGDINQYLIGAFAVGYLTGIDPLREIPQEILSSFLILTAGKRLTNAVVGRRGPKLKQGPRSFKFADGRSFPSGHSITIVTIARVLTHHVPHRAFRYPTLAAAGTVLLQRVTSDAHWPSDVVFGAAYGWVVTGALLKRKAERSRLRAKKGSASGGAQIVPILLEDGAVLGIAFALEF